jgi:glutaredoxin-like YruB-family protein
MYSTPSCIYCQKAKQYFDQIGVNYNNYDVSRDTRKAEEMVQKSGQMGVPVIVIKNQVIVGFDKSKIDRLLNLN